MSSHISRLRSDDLCLLLLFLGSTNANADSSRSHAIMQIVLKDQSRNVVGKLSFIDLAGSERGADRGETDAKTR